jgi:hypothetical protein
MQLLQVIRKGKHFNYQITVLFFYLALHRFGSGGKQESINAICILALNIINDKVFLVIWWWFLILIFLGFSRLIFRLVQMNSVRLRFYMLNLRMHRYFWMSELGEVAEVKPFVNSYRYFKRNENMAKIRAYIEECSRGDWFVLYQLSKNLNRPFFMDFLITLAKILEQEKNNPQTKCLR